MKKPAGGGLSDDRIWLRSAGRAPDLAGDRGPGDGADSAARDGTGGTGDGADAGTDGRAADPFLRRGAASRREGEKGRESK